MTPSGEVAQAIGEAMDLIKSLNVDPEKEEEFFAVLMYISAMSYSSGVSDATASINQEHN
jgi:hypothetical protein